MANFPTHKKEGQQVVIKLRKLNTMTTARGKKRAVAKSEGRDSLRRKRTRQKIILGTHRGNQPA